MTIIKGRNGVGEIKDWTKARAKNKIFQKLFSCRCINEIRTSHWNETIK